MKKRLFSLVMSLIMAVSLIGVMPTMTAIAETSGDYKYGILSNGTVVITRYNGSATNLTIPSTIKGKKVTSIGEYAFSGCEKLKSVTIPNGVRSIEGEAFYCCTNLTSIKLPYSLTSLSSDSFENTPLLDNQETNVKYIDKWVVDCDRFVTTISIKKGTVGIANYAFSDCESLKSVAIPNSVTSIGKGAFADCKSLKSITIPSSVTSIGNHAFEDTPWLKNKKLENSLVIINNILICASNASGNIIIPKGVTSILADVFAGCKSLKSVTIPNSVKSIGEGAFADCKSLKSVTIPNSVTSIEMSAFYYCTSLTSVTIPNSVTSIKDEAFRGCTSLKSITIPNSVKSIGRGAFADCKSLKSVKGFNGVKVINSLAFMGCQNLTNATIPNGVTEICYSTFDSCSKLTSITIPSSVKTITQWAFLNCSSLKNVIIGKNVSRIGPEAFRNCINIKSINIPKSVTEIYDSFLGCKNLKDVYYEGNEIDWKKIKLYGDELKNAKIHYNTCEVVTGFKAAATNANAIKLTWKKVSGAQGYILYKYDNTKKTWARVVKTTTNSNTYTVNKLSSGTSYKFAIRAYKTVNGKEIVSAIYPTLTTVTKPANVSGFKVSSTSTNSIKLTWNKVKGATGYTLYQQKNGKWTKVKSLTGTSYTVPKLKVGTTYKFAVKAYKKIGNSLITSPSFPTVSTSTNPATVNFKLSAGSKKATVKWSKVTGATGYKVYYKTSKNGSWKCLKTANNKTTSYTKTGLTKGKTYYFTVKAYRTVGGKTYNGSYVAKSVKVK